ncbi:MAG: MATE family efflux transporter [Candidatus Brocadiales bacterium]
MHTLEATEENLDKNIRRLAIPAATENLLHLMVFIVDVIMVGRLGTEAIAAVGMAGAVNFVLTMVFSSSSAGTVSLVARYCGAKDKPTAERVAAQSMLLALVLGLCLAPLLYFSAVNILYLMSVEPDVATLGAVYFRIVICFLPCRLIMLAGYAAFRGAGDTRTPMLITLVINCLNVLFNWLLIFGIWIFPRMEVAGAAWGTAISYTAGAVIVLVIIFGSRALITIRPGEVFTLDSDIMRRIFRISMPAATDAFLTQVGYLIFLKIVAMLGTASLAAHQIAIRIEAFSFMPGYALAVSTATLVGYSLGAGNENLAKLSMRRSCIYALMVMCTFGALFLLIPGLLASIFSPEPDVKGLVVICVMIAAIEQPALAVYMVYAGGLRGAGDTMSPMMITIVGTLFFHVPVAYLFGIVLGWGLPGIWFGAAIDWILRAIAVYILYRRGRWRRVKV